MQTILKRGKAPKDGIFTESINVIVCRWTAVRFRRQDATRDVRDYGCCQVQGMLFVLCVAIPCLRINIKSKNPLFEF